MNVVINNLLTSYSVAGPAEAPVVLMLHGWGATATSFDGLASHMVATHRVVRLDFPGFGGSQQPNTDWSVGDYAQFVADFLRKLELGDPAVIIGHSFGGRVILAGVGRSLLAPRRIVLIGSAGVKHSASARNQVFKMAAKTGKWAFKLPGLGALGQKARAKLYESAGSDYLTTGSMRQIFLNTINEDLRADAARIKLPALLLWGANDTDSPPADGQILANAIEGSSFSVLADAGHFTHIDAPDRVESLIDRFVS